jgi:2,5-diamino-6-(ribosylamino)-4(3H)-pyrimidinone 5'-phosphate reductase
MDPSDFVSSIVGHYVTEPTHGSRPHVTLTFAQSADSKISGINGQQLILSGKESMVMTHW